MIKKVKISLLVLMLLSLTGCINVTIYTDDAECDRKCNNTTTCSAVEVLRAADTKAQAAQVVTQVVGKVVEKTAEVPQETKIVVTMSQNVDAGNGSYSISDIRDVSADTTDTSANSGADAGSTSKVADAKQEKAQAESTESKSQSESSSQSSSASDAQSGNTGSSASNESGAKKEKLKVSRTTFEGDVEELDNGCIRWHNTTANYHLKAIAIIEAYQSRRVSKQAQAYTTSPKTGTYITYNGSDAITIDYYYGNGYHDIYQYLLLEE